MKKLILMFLLTGCSTPNDIGPRNGFNLGLIYSIDQERNVICYRFTGYDGISCLKLNGEK